MAVTDTVKTSCGQSRQWSQIKTAMRFFAPSFGICRNSFGSVIAQSSFRPVVRVKGGKHA